MSIYARHDGEWYRVDEECGSIAVEGAPPAPILTDKDGNDDASGGSVIYFKSGGDGDAGPTLAYGAEISPEDGATVTVDQDNLEVVVSGTTPDTDYVVSVYGVNLAGRGDSATTDAFQINYNKATGGVFPEGEEFTVTQNLFDNQTGNYFGTVGERWRFHKFTVNGGVNNYTFAVESNPKDFRVLLVGGGGSGGDPTNQSGGGGGGGMITKDSMSLEIKDDYSVTVGKGGNRGNGGDSVFAGFTAKGGGRGGKSGRGSDGGSGGGAGGGNDGTRWEGKGTAGQGNDGGWSVQGGGNTGGGGGGAGAVGGNSSSYNTGGNGGAGKKSDITGVSTFYAGGGGGGHNGGGGGGNGGTGGGGRWNNNGTNHSGGGGGGIAGNPSLYTVGGHGFVVVAYQIGISTTREIQKAEAEETARQAGVEEGLEQGIQQGYFQAQEDLQEGLNSLRTQIAGAAGTTETMLIDGKEQKVKRSRKR
jgi:hypothetical protein